MSAIDGGVDALPLPAMPKRPLRPLSLLKIARTGGANSLALCDEALFDELLVERRALWMRVFFVSDPEAVGRVLIDNFENYHRHFLMIRPIAPGLGTGMLIRDGAIWQRHRRLLGPTLDYRAMLPDAPALTALTTRLAEVLATLPANEPVDIGWQLSQLVTYEIGHVFAGEDDDAREMIVRMAKFPGPRRISDFLPALDPLRRRARQIRAEAQSWYPLLDRLIADRERPDYAGGHDLVWRLVHARTSDGDRLSHQEVRDEVLTLANGAIETTLRPMTWVWYLLALHPGVEERLHAELDAVLAGCTPSADDLRRLPYLRRVLDETMRLYPPIPMMLRTAVADDVLGGRKVPRGSTVVVSPWIIHRHRRLWDDPDRFDPERFTAERSAGRPRNAYLPFAVGPRSCVAAPLAMLQLSLSTAMLAQRFRFRLVPGRPVLPVGWSTLRPHGGIWVTIETR